MTRTSVDAVRDIIDVEELDDEELQAFVEDANVVVNDRLDGTGLSTARKTLIEKWLAAHLAAMKDQRIRKATIGFSTVEYEGASNSDDALGLQATRYGQQAVALDPSGQLDSYNVYVKTVNAED